MNGRPMTFAERMVLLEQESDQCQAARRDVETRLRDLERTIWKATGAVGLGLAVLQVILKYAL